MEPIEQHLEEDEGVTVPSGPKDAHRPGKAHNLSEVQQTKGVRDLSVEVEQLKQDLQVQTSLVNTRWVRARSTKRSARDWTIIF